MIEILELRRKIFLRIWMRHLVHGLKPFLLLVGTLLLGMRLLDIFVPWLTVTLLAGVFIPLLLLTRHRARKATPTCNKLTAWMDHHHQLGGMLLSGQEPGMEKWKEKNNVRNDIITNPRIHWRNGPAIMGASIAVAFFFACLLTPIQWLQQNEKSNHGLNISDRQEVLEEAIETLEELDLLTPEETSLYEEELSSLQEKADQGDTAQTWESIDQLALALQEKITKEGQSLQNTAEEASGLEALTNEVGEILAQDLAVAQIIEDAWRELIEHALSENPALGEALMGSDALGALNNKGTPLQPGDLEAMKNALSKAGHKAIDKLENLGQCKLAGTCELGEGTAMMENDGQLAAFLAEKQGKEAAEAALAMLQFLPGQGDPARGPGAAPLTWREAPESVNARFQPQALNSQISNPDEAQLVGLSLGTPVTDQSGMSRFDNISSGQGKSAGANTRQILPKHRAAVKHYFQKKE